MVGPQVKRHAVDLLREERVRERFKLLPPFGRQIAIREDIAGSLKMEIQSKR